MSDDYTAFESLSAYFPEMEFYTLIPSNYRGNFQYSFVFESVEEREKNTKRLITEISILSRAKVVACSFTSFVCRLIHSLRSPNATDIISVDHSVWQY